jgi:hypothetical protein
VSNRAITTQASWVKSRKSLVQRLKDQIQLRYGKESGEIKRYRQAYEKDLNRPWKISRWDDLLKSVEDAEFAFGGDFHAFSQSARTHLRVLREVPPSKDVVLGLEAIHRGQQAVVDKWLAAQITDTEFEKKLNWEKNWGFPLRITWPLLKLAQERRWRVLALSPNPTESIDELGGRDKFAAELLAQSHRKHPQALHYAVFGDLHIARPHLPHELMTLLAPEVPQTVSIYTNPENIYFQLSRRGLQNQVDVIKFNSSHFAILSSPPWVKWQSYLMFLEENYDMGLDDFESGIDHSEHVASLVAILESDLGLSGVNQDIHVYSAQDEGVDSLLEDYLKPHELQLAREIFRSNQSLYVPYRNFFYLAQPTVNHAATLAGQYIHAFLCENKHTFWSFPDDFEALTWVEACGYFLSKMINPRRKPSGLHDLRAHAEVFQSSALSKDALLLALDQSFRSLVERKGGRDLPAAFKSDHPMVYVLVSRFLGAKWGERIFDAIQNHDLSLSHLLKLMKMNPREFVNDSVSYRALVEITDRPTPATPRKVR